MSGPWRSLLPFRIPRLRPVPWTLVGRRRGLPDRYRRPTPPPLPWNPGPRYQEIRENELPFVLCATNVLYTFVTLRISSLVPGPWAGSSLDDRGQVVLGWGGHLSAVRRRGYRGVSPREAQDDSGPPRSEVSRSPPRGTQPCLSPLPRPPGGPPFYRPLGVGGASRPPPRARAKNVGRRECRPGP